MMKVATLMKIVKLHRLAYGFLYPPHVAAQYIIQTRSTTIETAIMYHIIVFCLT